MTAVFVVLNAILDIYWWIVIASVVFSWLFAFGVVNAGNQFVAAVSGFLYEATEPVLRRIRRFMPNLGSIDISPIVLLLAIMFAKVFLNTTIASAVGVNFSR